MTSDHSTVRASSIRDDQKCAIFNNWLRLRWVSSGGIRHYQDKRQHCLNWGEVQELKNELLNELMKDLEREKRASFIRTAKKKSLRHSMVIIARARNWPIKALVLLYITRRHLENNVDRWNHGEILTTGDPQKTLDGKWASEKS